MTNISSRLPLDNYSFSQIIESNSIYVDKTSYIEKIVAGDSKVVFLSRPRGFGKTLTVSTLEALFSGRKELFQGLEVERRLDDGSFAPRPVIKLDMLNVDTDDGPDTVRKSLGAHTCEVAQSSGIEVDPGDAPGTMLGVLIEKLGKGSERGVALLIDAYDSAYMDFIQRNRDDLEAVRNIFRNYYKILKSKDQYFFKVFVTGVCKPPRETIFAGLNNLYDISMGKEFGAICGFTVEELRRLFGYRIEAAAEGRGVTGEEMLAAMIARYDGFCFDGKTRVFNPLDVLNFLHEKQFRDFWFEAGSPPRLAEYMKERRLTVEEFQGIEITSDFARTPGELDLTPPEGLLYQTGCLTLRPGKRAGLYTLDYPNTGVLVAMSRLMMNNLAAGGALSEIDRGELLKALAEPNPEAVVDEFNLLYDELPYDDFVQYHIKAKKLDKIRNQAIRDAKINSYREFLLGTVITTSLVANGLSPRAEEPAASGGFRLEVEHGGWAWIIGLKMSHRTGADLPRLESDAEDALDPLVGSCRAGPFRERNRVALGVAVDVANKTIGAWRSRIDSVPRAPSPSSAG